MTTWIEYINSPLVLTTGDGREYKPLWKNAKKENEFNSTKFNFVNRFGTFIFRGKRPGSGYALELYFTGAQCIDLSNNFDKSLSDERPIIMEHPYWGIKKVQPLSILIDNSKLNVSKVTLSVFETIESNQPSPIKNTEDAVFDSIEETNTAISSGYADKVNTNSTDIKNINESIEVSDSFFLKMLKFKDDVSEYKQNAKAAVRAANNVITDAKTAIDRVNALLNFPAQVKQTIGSRVGALKGSLDKLTERFNGKNDVNSLSYYTSYGASILNSMLLTAITPNEGDYTTRQSLVDVIDIISNAYYDYLAVVDASTSDDAGIKGNFAPDFGTMQSLYNSVTLALSSLTKIISNTKIERTFINDKDNNIIVITHRLYGLKTDDSTIDNLIDLNDFKKDKMHQIRVGTPIKYIR